MYQVWAIKTFAEEWYGPKCKKFQNLLSFRGALYINLHLLIRSLIFFPLSYPLSLSPHAIVNLHIQKDNGGIVMVNFYSNYINCTDPDEATVEQVAG